MSREISTHLRGYLCALVIAALNESCHRVLHKLIFALLPIQDAQICERLRLNDISSFFLIRDQNNVIGSRCLRYWLWYYDTSKYSSFIVNPTHLTLFSSPRNLRHSHPPQSMWISRRHPTDGRRALPPLFQIVPIRAERHSSTIPFAMVFQT